MELLEAISRYSQIRADLGVRFEKAASATIRLAADHPERGAPRSMHTRRLLITGFPFGVIYRAGAQEIVIVAIAHSRRRPGYWQGRNPA